MRINGMRNFIALKNDGRNKTKIGVEMRVMMIPAKQP